MKNLLPLGMPMSVYWDARHTAGRRTLITNAAKKISSVGGSLRDVQMLAGHSSLAVTQRYIEGMARRA